MGPGATWGSGSRLCPLAGGGMRWDLSSLVTQIILGVYFGDLAFLISAAEGQGGLWLAPLC